MLFQTAVNCCLLQASACFQNTMPSLSNNLEREQSVTNKAGWHQGKNSLLSVCQQCMVNACVLGMQAVSGTPPAVQQSAGPTSAPTDAAASKQGSPGTAVIVNAMFEMSVDTSASRGNNNDADMHVATPATMRLLCTPVHDTVRMNDSSFRDSPQCHMWIPTSLQSPPP